MHISNNKDDIEKN
uniref:Uncharacterized protein n=1 Tax=Anguilla anguilla TaxID=7936 RepID=A0A0E9XX95_ANGAN